MAKNKKRNVVVTTNGSRRGVFMGELVKHDIKAETCTLKNAYMCVYWSEETKGVLGLAGIGPQSGSRITPAVPSIELNGVTCVMDMTKDAVEKWQEQPWG